MAKQSFIDSMGGTSGLIGAGLSLLPTAVKAFTAFGQRRRANEINPNDPGFVANPELANNQRILNNQYNNYTLPGMSEIQGRQDAGFAKGMSDIIQGSTSSADVLNGVSILGDQRQKGINALGVAEAEQKNALLPQVLNANAIAGNELVRKNQYDQQEYQRLSQEKADLMGASVQNGFSAVDDAATLGGSLLNYKVQPWKKGALTNFNSLGSVFN